MKRRGVEQVGQQVPDVLAEYDRSDWPGLSQVDALAAWREARSAYADEHGWPTGGIDKIRVERATRRGLKW